MSPGRPPSLVVVAGPNGSGKSTLTAALRADPGVRLPSLYINADDIERSQGIDAVAAQRVATLERSDAIAARRDVMYETVMSHPARLAELQKAQVAGYDITLHLVATDDPAINLARVALRVAAGGHPVSDDRVRQRYQRTMTHAPIACAHANAALLFDNSRRGSEGGLELQAQLVGQRLVASTHRPAAWVRRLMDLVEAQSADIGALKAVVPSGLAAANLNGGTTEGPVVVQNGHYVLQHDTASQSQVAHHRTLLAGELSLGMRYRISYEEGVATIEALP